MNEPVFETKNGYGRLVDMGIDYYERTMRKIGEATLINQGIADYEDDRTSDGKSTMQKLRKKHGI